MLQYKYMETLIKIVKSRNVWTVVLMFIIGGVNGITQYIPDEISKLILGILTVLAVYFKINPSQKY